MSKRKKKKTVGDQVTFVFPYEDDKIIYDWLNAQNNATNALRVLIKEVIRVNGGIFDMSTGSPLLNKQLHVHQYNNDYSTNENKVASPQSEDSVGIEIKNESMNKKEAETGSVDNEEKTISPEERKNNNQNSIPEEKNEENNIVVNLNDLL